MQLFRRLNHAVLAFTAVHLFVPADSVAQTQETKATTARLSPFLSATIGLGTLDGGTYVAHRKVNGELMVGVQRVTDSPISHLAGVVVGVLEWRGGYHASCRIAVGGGCVPSAPETRYAAFVVGAQLRKNLLTVSAMAGPGLFGVGNSAIFRRKDPNATTIYGTVLRADLWFRVVKHLEVGASASTRIMPAYRHQRVSANTVSTGFRVYR